MADEEITLPDDAPEIITPGARKEEVAVDPDVMPPVFSPSRHLIASSTPFQKVTSVEQAKQIEAGKTSFASAVGMAFTSGGNVGASLYQDWTRRANSGPVDPQWADNRKEWMAQNADGINQTQAWRYSLTNNKNEAEAMLADSQEMARKGNLLRLRGESSPISTTLALGLPMFIDVDTPLVFASGGYSAAAKAAINATRFGRITGAIVTGASVNAALATTAFVADPTSEWTSIPLAGLAGAALGGIVGAASKANRIKAQVERDFGEDMVDGNPMSKADYREPVMANDVFEPEYKMQERMDAQAEIDKAAGREPQAIDLSNVEQVSGEIGSTAGARQITGAAQPVSSIRNTRVAETIGRAKQWAVTSGVPKEWFDNFSNIDIKVPGVGRAARRFQDFVNASPVASDFARLMRSNSSVAQKLAYDLFENASGIIRNNRNGAGLHRMYQQQLHNSFKDYAPSMDAWMADVHGAGAFRRATDFKLHKEFNEAVIAELQYRKYKTGLQSTNEHILRAADEVDKWSAHELRVRQGQPGEYHEKGTEDVKPQSGYYPQQWLGAGFRKLLDAGKTRQDLVLAVKETYMHMHPAMKPKDADIYASAVVDRSMRQADGLSMNLRSAMDADGRSAVENMLKNNGASEKDVSALIDRLTGSMETAGVAGNMKRRLDVDMRTTTSNGIRMMDLFDTDVYGMMSRRSNKAAGAGALARKGIASKQDWDDIVEAIVQEQGLSTIPPRPAGFKLGEQAEHFIDKDRHLTKADLDDLYSYFSGRPIEGSISPNIQRVIKLTNLSFLGQLGLTQLAEFGPAIAAQGFTKFMKNLPDDLSHALRNKDSALTAELKHLGVMEPEERLFRYDNVYSHERAMTEDASLMSKFDTMLNRGQRLQGFTSLFYQIRRVQHKMAVTTGTDRIMNTLRGVEGVSDARMRDLGFDQAISARIKKYVDDGTVEFENGSVKKLNLDKWTNQQDVEDFTIAINRYTDQQVQRAMIGESSAVFRKGGIESLFWHLKAFPMLALEKQTLRTLRLADDESMGMFFYSLAAAGAAYTTKQVINLNDKNLTPERIMTGAFGLSNITGWMPMWIDPVASMFGLPGIQNYNREQGPISTPAALTALNQMAQLPGAVGRLVNPFVEGTNNDLRTLQSIPIIGRMVGITGLLNAMKD